MNQKEKLQKMTALQVFCRQNEISEDELLPLFNECVFAVTMFPYDILYADGSVSRVPDLTKDALAVKIQITFPKEYFIWLSMKTSYPQQMTKADACRYVDGLSPINGKQWRLPVSNELFFFSNSRTRILDNVDRLRCFFELPVFWKIAKNDPDGRFVSIGTSDDVGYCPFFLGLENSLEENDKCYWWSVCDV